MLPKLPQHKLVVVGDSCVGKTALAVQFALQGFVEVYEPTIEDSYRTRIEVDGQPCMVEVIDTAGDDEFAFIRKQDILVGEAFILVYSISSRSSFVRIQEIHHQIQQVKGTSATSSSHLGSLDSPITLVGNKSDQASMREVSTQEGEEMARGWGCNFVEISAKDLMVTRELFFNQIRQLRKQRQSNARQIQVVQVPLRLDGEVQGTAKKPKPTKFSCYNLWKRMSLRMRLKRRGK